MLYMRVLTLVFGLLLLAACTPGGPQPTPTPTPSPAELLTRAGQATQTAQTLRFSVTLAGAPVYTDSSRLFALRSMEGALRRPDAVLTTLAVRSAAGLAEIRTVSLDGQQYATNPLTRAWQCLAPGTVYDPATLFAAERGLESLLQGGVEEIALVGEEEIGGRPTYHLRGTVPGERMVAVSGGMVGAGPVQLDVWADKESFRATQIVLVDTATDTVSPTTWTMTFNGYDEPVDVRAPATCP
jgi:lipoprotein LprG